MTFSIEVRDGEHNELGFVAWSSTSIVKAWNGIEDGEPSWDNPFLDATFTLNLY